MVKKSGIRLSRWYRVAVSALALYLCCASLVTAQSTQADLDEVIEKASTYRDLEVLEDIEVEYYSLEDLMQDAEDNFDSWYPAAWLESQQRTMYAFGMVEDGFDLGEFYLNQSGGDVAGFYQPATGQLVVVLPEGVTAEEFELNAWTTYVLAHEVTHALQDQHFDIDSDTFWQSSWSSDQIMAADAIIEGDAMFMEDRLTLAEPYFAQLYYEWSEEQARLTEEEGGTYDDYPPFMYYELWFPYIEGRNFIAYLYNEGGYDLVNEAFIDPPMSSEQILHPEKYLEGEEPEDIDVVRPDVVLGGDWEWTDFDALGEYYMRQLMIIDGVNEEDATNAAAGWNGDYFAVGGDGDDTVVVWPSVWDTDDDAEEFLEYWLERETNRLDADVDTDGDVWILSGDDEVVLMTIDDDEVIYVQAPDEDTAFELLEAQQDL